MRVHDPETHMEPTNATADDIRRKAAEYDERGDPKTAEILRSVADEMDAAPLPGRDEGEGEREGPEGKGGEGEPEAEGHRACGGRGNPDGTRPRQHFQQPPHISSGRSRAAISPPR